MRWEEWELIGDCGFGCAKPQAEALKSSEIGVCDHVFTLEASRRGGRNLAIWGFCAESFCGGRAAQ